MKPKKWVNTLLFNRYKKNFAEATSNKKKLSQKKTHNCSYTATQKNTYHTIAFFSTFTFWP